jgi:ribosomal protein S18 acetylase RimI-like enzyme
MPEISIRPIQSNDIDTLSAFEHGYYSEYAWQMNMDLDAQNYKAEFRRVHLPRRIMVSYPRKREEVFSDIDNAEAFLIAELNGRSVGYVKVMTEEEENALRVTDLVVSGPMRRQGIASGLLVAVMNLASNRDFHYLMLEMQSKNEPAIALAGKLGFNFCGFRDHYFSNQELALFFSRFVR